MGMNVPMSLRPEGGSLKGCEGSKGMCDFTVSMFIGLIGYRFMPIVNDDTLDVTYPELQPDERLHIVINHDEMSIATNEPCRRHWLAEGQQPLRKKGTGCSV